MLNSVSQIDQIIKKNIWIICNLDRHEKQNKQFMILERYKINTIVQMVIIKSLLNDNINLKIE